MTEQTIDLSSLSEKLPPIISRDRIEKYLGGAITAKRLANLDSEGSGPPRFRVGRKVVYETPKLLEWLANRSEILK